MSWFASFVAARKLEGVSARLDKGQSARVGDNVPTQPEGDISIASGEKGTTCTDIHYSHKPSHGHDMCPTLGATHRIRTTLRGHLQKSSAIVKEVILGIGVVYLHNSRVSSTNDLVP